MLTSKLLIVLAAFSCLKVANCKAFEAYDVNEDFKESLKTLREKLDDEVEMIVQLMEDVLVKMRINAREDKDLTVINLFQYEYNAENQISKLQNEENKDCIEELRENLVSSSSESYLSLLRCHENFVRDSAVISGEGLQTAGDFLELPNKFRSDFNSCEDDACKSKVAEEINEEIPLIEEQIAEATVQFRDGIQEAWFVANQCYADYKKTFVDLADKIVEDAENCK